VSGVRFQSETDCEEFWSAALWIRAERAPEPTYGPESVARCLGSDPRRGNPKRRKAPHSIALAAGLFFAVSAPADDWKLAFSDDFERPRVGGDWVVNDGEWSIEDGWLTGNGEILCLLQFAGPQRLEFDARTAEGHPAGDLSGLLAATGMGFRDAYLFGFGSNNNSTSKLQARGSDVARYEAGIEPGKIHRMICDWDGKWLTHIVDGEIVQRTEPEVKLTGPNNTRIGFYLWHRGQIDNVRVYTPTGNAVRPGEWALADGTGPEGTLVFTAAQLMGFSGSQSFAMGNSIRVVDATGENHAVVRQLKGHLWTPVWSPDGERIAFCHYADGRGQIYVMNADGSGARNVSRNAYCDRSPAWSPDGRAIAFVSDRDGDWEIYRMDPDNPEAVRLTQSPGRDAHPVWSPGGTYIAFESERNGLDNDIYVMDADGSNQRVGIHQAGHVEEPVWSPDETRLAGIGLDHPWRGFMVMKDLTDDLPPRRVELTYFTHIESITWSPNGAFIAGIFRGPQPKEDMSGIFVVPADGGEHQILLHVGSLRPHPGGGLRALPTVYSSGSASRRWLPKTMAGLCWSPDSRHLAFSSDMGEEGAFYIYTLPREGGSPLTIGATRSAWPQQVMWRPSG
jgi:hypothetical protein